MEVNVTEQKDRHAHWTGTWREHSQAGRPCSCGAGGGGEIRRTSWAGLRRMPHEVLRSNSPGPDGSTITTWGRTRGFQGRVAEVREDGEAFPSTGNRARSDESSPSGARLALVEREGGGEGMVGMTA